jgi:hypothetical protein
VFTRVPLSAQLQVQRSRRVRPPHALTSALARTSAELGVRYWSRSDNVTTSKHPNHRAAESATLVQAARRERRANPWIAVRVDRGALVRLRYCGDHRVRVRSHAKKPIKPPVHPGCGSMRAVHSSSKAPPNPQTFVFVRVSRARVSTPVVAWTSYSPNVSKVRCNSRTAAFGRRPRNAAARVEGPYLPSGRRVSRHPAGAGQFV